MEEWDDFLLRLLYGNEIWDYCFMNIKLCATVARNILTQRIRGSNGVSDTTKDWLKFMFQSSHSLSNANDTGRSMQLSGISRHLWPRARSVLT
jgi:hypothetical protein